MFAAIAELNRESKLIINEDTGLKIYNFLEVVQDKDLQNKSKDELNDYQKKALDYYKAAKSSFTDAGPRKTRIEIIKSLLKGDINLVQS